MLATIPVRTVREGASDDPSSRTTRSHGAACVRRLPRGGCSAFHGVGRASVQPGHPGSPELRRRLPADRAPPPLAADGLAPLVEPGVGSGLAVIVPVAAAAPPRGRGSRPPPGADARPPRDAERVRRVPGRPRRHRSTRAGGVRGGHVVTLLSCTASGELRDELARAVGGGVPLGDVRPEILHSWRASIGAGLQPGCFAPPLDPYAPARSTWSERPSPSPIDCATTWPTPT